MSKSELFKQFDKTNENIRIGNIRQIYRCILLLGAQVQNVEDMGNNTYRVTMGFNYEPMLTVYLAPHGAYDRGIYDVLKAMQKVSNP